MKFKFLISEYVAAGMLVPDLVVTAYNRSAPVLPLDWPRIAADVILQMAENISHERDAAKVKVVPTVSAEARR
jgi:hypothetical protein